MEIKTGSLVEADVIGTPGTFRVVDDSYRPALPGMVWIREVGLHLKGQQPFMIEWPTEKCRVVG